MAAPLRIKRPPGKAAPEDAQPASSNADGIKEYLGRLVKMIPSEVVGVYMVGAGYITADDHLPSLVWSIFCFLLVIVVRVWGTRDPKNHVPPEIPLVIISAVSFVIWLYWLGGPFMAYFGTNKFASLIVLGWTFVVPIFYKQE